MDALPPNNEAELRGLMFSIGYRMTGSVAETEDLVQEAFFRLERARRSGVVVESPKAYLATATTRLAIDHMRSARARRESYVGTWLPEPVRKRQFPIVGDGGGYASWLHLEDAAAATVLAIEHEGPAIYNITDDEPAPLREWLPALVRALGAKPPRRVPVWLARLIAGEVAVLMSTDARGASNAKAKRELRWTLRYPSWRQGFAATY